MNINEHTVYRNLKESPDNKQLATNVHIHRPLPPQMWTQEQRMSCTQQRDMLAIQQHRNGTKSVHCTENQVRMLFNIRVRNIIVKIFARIFHYA